MNVSLKPIVIIDERKKTPTPYIEACLERCPIHEKKRCELEVRGHRGKCAHMMPDGRTVCTFSP